MFLYSVNVNLVWWWPTDCCQQRQKTGRVFFWVYIPAWTMTLADTCLIHLSRRSGMARAVTHLLQILPQHTKQKLLYCMWDKPYTRQRQDCSDFRICIVLWLSLTLLNESADITSVLPSSSCFSMATCFGAESCFLPWNVLVSKLVKECVVPSKLSLILFLIAVHNPLLHWDMSPITKLLK